MAFTLVKHTDLEILAADLSRALRARPEGHFPLDPEYLIVQTPGMKKWIALEAAKRNGAFARVEALTPVQFIMKLGFLLLRQREDRTIFEKDILPWAIFRILSDDIAAKIPDVEALSRYCDSGAENASVRLFSLSGSIADIMDQYMLSRPDWLARWEKGERIPDLKVLHPSGKREDGKFPEREEERWQAHIWRRLCEQGGDNPSRADYFDRLEAAMHSSSEQHLLPKRIFLFGMSLLPPRFLHIFALLGNIIEVKLFLQVPSIHYVGDLLDDRTLSRLAAHGRDTEKLKLHGGNRLLANFGTTGREFMELILAEEPQETDLLLYDEESALSTSLLNAVKEDIRLCRDPRDVPESIDEREWSVRLARCSDPLREVEVLHDLLLETLQADRSIAPSDILVVTPDVETYAPLIDMVFAGARDRCGVEIPYSIADRSALTENRTLRLLSDILKASTGRFALAEILPLFVEVRELNGTPLDSSEQEMLERWCTDAGIRWGRNGESKAALGLPNDATLTWEAGFDRLFAGFAVDGSDPLDDGIIPAHGPTPKSAELLGSCAAFVDTIGELADMKSALHPVSVWITLLGPLFNRLLSAGREPVGDDVPPLAIVASALGKIEVRITTAGLTDKKFALDLIAPVLLDELSGSGGGGNFLAGKVTVSGMVPMRSIPFRIVAMVGMNRGKFPRHTVRPEYDLMRLDSRIGDRDTLESDRYLFLETLLAAQDRLIITASGLTDDGAPSPLSGVVEQLMRELDHEFSIYGVPAGSAVTVRYPLQAGSLRYRSNDEKDRCIRTYNYKWFTKGDVLSPSKDIFKWQRPASGAIDPAVIDGELLCRVLADPARFFIETGCGVTSPRREDSLPEREMFALDGISSWGARDALIDAGLFGDAFAIDRLRVSGGMPLGNPGVLMIEKEKRTIDGRLEKLREFIGDVPFEHKRYREKIEGVDCRFGGIIASAPSKAALIDAGDMKPKRRIRHWVTHLFENLVAPTETALFCRNERVILSSIDKSEAFAILENLHQIVIAAYQRFLPLYPDASWAYFNPGKDIRKQDKPPLQEAWSAMQKGPLADGHYHNEWIAAAFDGAEAFSDVGVESEFVALSKRLFERYCEVKQ